MGRLASGFRFDLLLMLAATDGVGFFFVAFWVHRGAARFFRWSACMHRRFDLELLQRTPTQD
jgi:hypothetical protein